MTLFHKKEQERTFSEQWFTETDLSGQGITVGPDVMPAICEKHLLGCNPSENTDVECAFTLVHHTNWGEACYDKIQAQAKNAVIS